MQSEVMRIVVQAILSILGVVVTYAITILVSYLAKKKEAIIKQIGAEEYNIIYNISKSIFYAVEQQYKNIPGAGIEKKVIFDQLLKEKVPELKQEDLDHFREAIVGEINMKFNELKLLEAAPPFDPNIHEADIKIKE
ncbi:hypothetical protein HGG79_17280 [Clostridium tetanomorphum]|uniref:Uncharacterized protein n=1 Tax=Clostridium tetanomorphum TaxID=1553 RepID=A0A923EDV7_CLOTT|nr:hypothetical protein [Clostridium tetanomorphum]